MNICLIYPLLSKERSKIDENKQFWPPLGLAYIASVLEGKGHKVEIIDRDLLLRKNNLNFDLVDKVTVDKIDEMGADMVGIGGTTPTFTDVVEIAKLVKRRNPGRTIVFGGPHASAEPLLTLKECPFIDILVRGEGEFTMLDIASGKALSDISGITFRKNKEPISNPNRPLYPNIDDIPFPARHLLDMEFYTRPSRFTSRNLSLKTTSVFTARGCPYSCNYCAGPLMFEGKVRFHSPRRVISEINELVDIYGVEAIYFAEDMFLSNKIRAKQFMDLLINSGLNSKIKWFVQIRSNVVDEDLLHLMKRAGCIHVEYGFESGSQRILDMMGKRVKLEENINAAKITKACGLRFQANIIVGYPGETERDFLNTVDFIKKIKPNSIGFNIFMPLPGTPIYEKLKAEKKPIPPWDEIGDPEGTQVSYADMPRERFYELYFKARLNVILPLNLYYFIKDNLNNPLRLVWIMFSQFKGVIIKTARSLGKLKSCKKIPMVMYVSYNAVSDPVFQSQGISYLKGLKDKGFDFLLLTFEKQNGRLNECKKLLGEFKSDWHALRYHKRPYLFSTLWDILCGNFFIVFMLARYRIKIIHARGVIAGTMSFLPALLYRRRFVFDMRSSLAGAYASAGHWKRNSLIYKLVRFLEGFFVRHSDFAVVETSVHADMLYRKSPKTNMPPLEIIPCCVDLRRFQYKPAQPQTAGHAPDTGIFKLLYIGSLSGWYMLDEMLDFFCVLKEKVTGSQFLFLTNDEYSRLADMASRRPALSEGIQFKSVGFNEVAFAALGMDAGIVFTKSSERLESMPVKIGEYLACGLPIIVNKGMGDAEELIRQHKVGVVLEGFNNDAYQKAAHELLEIMKEGDGLKERCRRVAQDYLSLDIGVAKYDNIYRKLSCSEEPFKL